MIEVQDLVKRYGGRCAVDHLSFTVEDGQIFGLLGPNGAGKSTTMNMMTGYLAVTEGRVVIQGHDVLEDPEAARRCVGYLPEVPPVYPEMTAEEYLLFAAELKKIPAGEREEQVEKVLFLTGTEEARDRLVRNLSKGYRQRLGLAQAILGFPPVIILDEPTVGLDPKQVVEIRQLIRNLGRNHTVLLSSHILSEIRAVCDKVLILRKGKAVACDTPEALEASLSQDHGLELQCRGGGKEARTLALSIPGVTGCTVTGEAGGTASLALEADRDVRENVFRSFAGAGVPLLELRSRTATLEDVFLDLTDDDDAVAARAAALLGSKAPEQTEKEGKRA